MTAPAASEPVPNRGLITVSIMLATIMQAIDTTIANVALPHMQGSLSASQDQIAWVLTSYIVAAAIMTPLTGWLSGRFGRKRVFLISVAGFTVTSMLCGAAASLEQIVLYRLLQGIFGAALAFVVQPGNVAVGATITPAVQVEIRDQFGNRVTGASNSVTLDIGNNPGSGTLGGTVTVAAVSGVATFSSLSIDKVGTGYTLTAAATSLSGATSSAFNVTGVPPSASLSTVAASPTSITAGGAGATITVTARTAGGRPAKPSHTDGEIPVSGNSASPA